MDTDHDVAPKNKKQTMASRTVNVKATEPLRIVTKSVSQDSIDRAEICHSPSWSDHGKEERKRKEKERRLREEENKKPPKRLNKKPPPAAMDTQRMSTDLRNPRRNSITSLMSRSSSREPSQERPQRERRLSGASLAAFLPGRRSQSQQRLSVEPEKGFKPIVSATAPKLPSFRFKSTNDTKTSWGENNASHASLVGFPYDHQPEPETKAEPVSRRTREKTSKPMARTSMEPVLKDKKASDLNTARSQPSKQVDQPTTTAGSTKSNLNGRPKAPDMHQRKTSDEVAEELIAMLSKPSPTQQQGPFDKPINNSNYVHKQRMYEQQRSLADFGEQQALQMFNEQAALAAMQQDVRDVQAKTKKETSPARTNRSRSKSRDARNRRTSRSPAPRASSQQPKQAALSPLKQVSSAPEESDDEDEKFKRAKEEIAQKMQSFQLKSLQDKPEKKFGFRRKNRDVSLAKEEKPILKSAVKEEKQSTRNRMSAHMPFSKKRESSVPALSRFEQKETVLVPPSPITSRPSHSRQSSSMDSTESWHSTSEKPDLSLKRADTTASLAAAYSEGLKTPSSEEDLSDFQPAKEKEKKQQEKKTPALVVESVTDTGIIRKASITRPKSIPNLQTQSTSTMPNLDFLPQLKHQPLPKSRSPLRSADPSSAESSPTRTRMPVPEPGQQSLKPNADLAILPRSPLRSGIANRSSTSIATPGLTGSGGKAGVGVDAKPIAKLFVICCKCRFWHDLPSKLYEAMALPKDYVKAKGEAGLDAAKEMEGLRKGVENAGEEQGLGKGMGKLKGRLETAVMCPWCDHGMTTACCQGWTTVVYMHERHH